MLMILLTFLNLGDGRCRPVRYQLLRRVIKSVGLPAQEGGNLKLIVVLHGALLGGESAMSI